MRQVGRQGRALSRRSVTLALVIAAGATGACRHRLLVPGEDAGVASHDGWIVPPKGLPDGYVPAGCMKEHLPITTWNDERGQLTLALPAGAQVQAVSIAGAGGLESAAVVNHGAVAALAATRGGAGDPIVELAAIQQRFSDDLDAAGLGSLSVRASGSSGKSHEGWPDVKQAIWDVEPASSVEAGALRDALLGAVLAKPAANLGNLLGPVGSPATQLVVQVTLVHRSNQVAVSAAVASRDDYESPSGEAAITVEDLSNGTALAKAGSTTILECDVGAVTTVPAADIIWVIDESGSMNDNRQDIANHANTFFSMALSAGLDFRMGVTGVKKPEKGLVAGKFCSRSSTVKEDDGGEDRFLLPNEQALFSACVWNPPYYEGSQEYGLTAGYSAVKQHLPREASSPKKIREGAKLAVIFVTDETPQELKTDGTFLGQAGFLSFNDYKSSSCSLSAGNSASLATTLKPLSDLLAGVTDPGAEAMVHLIGGACGNSCDAEIAYGYKELAAARGGQTGDVCQKNLGPTLQVILSSIASSASPRPLQHVPISSSLVVEANGLRLPRSMAQGYTYNAAANALTFINVQVVKGTVVGAAYRRFSGQ